MLNPKILVGLSFVILAISIFSNARQGIKAGLEGGGEIWAVVIVIETIYLVRIALFLRKFQDKFTEVERRKIKRTGFWLLLPAGLLLLTGIGMIALFSTFLSFTIASVLCLWSAFLVSRQNAAEVP